MEVHQQILLKEYTASVDGEVIALTLEVGFMFSDLDDNVMTVDQIRYPSKTPAKRRLQQKPGIRMYVCASIEGEEHTGPNSNMYKRMKFTRK